MSRKSNIQPRRRLLNLAVLAALGGGALAPASVSAADLYWAGNSNTCWAWYGACWSATPGGAPTLRPPQDGDNGFLSTGSSRSYNDNYEIVGNFGTATFTQTGGENWPGYFLILGYNSGSNGTYNLSGTGSLTADHGLAIGYYGTGTFNQAGDTNTVATHYASHVIIGTNSGSSGTYNLSAGNLSAANESIGYSGTGTFTQSGGTNAVGSNLYLGRNSGSIGTYNLNGTGNLSATDGYIGNSGTGIFTQNGGTNLISRYLVLGNDSSGNGSYNLTGGSLSAPNEYIGNSGTGTFTQSGGTHTVSGSINLGYGSGSSGTYNLSAGNLSAGYEHIGLFGAGTFNQSGGTHAVTGIMMLAGNVGSSGSYNLTGGTLNVGGGIANNAGGSFHVGTGATATVGGLGLVNYGLLGGTGTVVGNVISSGNVGPGNSPGMLSITGDYTQSATGTFTAEIGGLLAGTQYDVLNVSGTAFLDGLLNVSLYDLGGGMFRPHAGDYFDIITASVLQGNFSSMSFAALSDPNLFWRVDYLTDAIGTTDVVRLSIGQNAAPVPEPETYAMLLAGLGLMGFAGRRRNVTSGQAA